MPKLDFHQTQELEKILCLAPDKDVHAKVISQMIHDRDASQRLLVDLNRELTLYRELGTPHQLSLATDAVEELRQMRIGGKS